MYSLLGQSTAIKRASPAEARLALVALYALALLPLMLVFLRGAAEGLGSLIAVLFLIRSVLQRDWAWLREPPVVISLVLWGYITLVVTPLAMAPLPSFERAITWIRQPLFFAALAYWLAAYGEELGRVARFIAFVLGLIMLDALVQYITGWSLTGHEMRDIRLNGPFSHLVVGIFLAKMTFPVAGLWLYRACAAENRRQVFLSLGFLTCALIMIVLSNERTALIGFSCGLALIAALLLRIKKARGAVLTMITVLAALVLALYKTQPHLSARVEASQHMLSGFADSPYGQLWIASFEIWKHHPLFGAGLMGFRSQCLPLLQQGIVHYCDLHSHNLYLEWLSESGLFGLFGFMALILSLMMVIVRARPPKPAGVALTAFALASFMPTFFPLMATQSFFSNWPAWLAWLPISLAAAIVRSTRYEA